MSEYEALGRYTAFKEKAEALARERNHALSELKRLISAAMGGESGHLYAYKFETAKAEELLSRSVRLHHEMMQAIGQANDAAAECGKQPLTTIAY
jgi:hypothetical protein